MNKQEALDRMISPGMARSIKPHAGVIQIHLTRACPLACYSCTQASNIGGKTYFITLDNFDLICQSLRTYPWILGIFGGCPNTHPQFDTICEILRGYFPKDRCGLWSNNLMGKGASCRVTFNPAVSNLNVHMVRSAYEEMLRDWPECRPFGLVQDSRHSPPYVAIKDVIHDESERWELISKCPINARWSALAGQFRGEARGYFCEIAGSQSILYQDDPSYPDTGIKIPCECNGTGKVETTTDTNEKYRTFSPCKCKGKQWWQLGMDSFSEQVEKHCMDCGVALNSYGELAQRDDLLGKEQVSETHKDIYQPKRKGRRVELVTVRSQLEEGKITRTTDYLQNSTK